MKNEEKPISMKTKEELNTLKNEVKDLNAKLAELSEDELKEVTGGVADERTAHVAFCDAYHALIDVLSSFRGSDRIRGIIEEMMYECMDAYTRPCKTVIETVNKLKELYEKYRNSRTTIPDIMISDKICNILSDLYSKLEV